MGIDCSGNSLMGLGRCHFTSAMIKAIAVDDGGGGGLWIVEAEGKNRNSPREEARRQAGQGREARKELRELWLLLVAGW